MNSIAWGAKVSSTFLDRVKWIVEDLQIGESTADGMSNLMACIAWETGRTFSASVVNKAGSGATGLIQFMPATARGLGTTTAKLAKMKAEDQLNYVWKYFASYKGKLKTLSDLYMAILWPKAVGKPETYVLWNKQSMPTTYRQNSGIDINKDGDIIKAEATAKLSAMLVEGLSAKNRIDYGATTASHARVEPDDTTADEDTLVLVEEAARDRLQDLVDTGKDVVRETSVVETVEAVTSVVVRPNDKVTAIKRAVSGWQGNLSGVALVVGALLLDPSFSARVGALTVAFANGSGRTGAVLALVGAALVAYRSASAIK